MEDPTLTKIITRKSAIVRYMLEISEQNLPLIIAANGTDKHEEYRSSIMKVEAENNQLLLRQLLPGNRGSDKQFKNGVEVVCHSQKGKLKFNGSISSIDSSEKSLYYQLTLPEHLSKKQLRACFRVPVIKYKSEILMALEEGTEVFGTCMDISMSGALFFLPIANKKIMQGHLIEQCRIAIDSLLDISCSVKICHVESTPSNNMLIGLSFLDLGFSQLNKLRPAITKVERLNITKKTFLKHEKK